MDNFNQQIAPFQFTEEDDNSYSVILEVGEYKVDLFETRADEGFEGNGYDWQSLASVFLKEELSDLMNLIHFDSESSTFYAYSDNNKEALKHFVLAFRTACENDELIRDVFSRAELD